MSNSKIKYGCMPVPNYIGTSKNGGITPIDGKIYWHVDEASLTKDMEKYKILFAIEQAFKVWQPYFHNVKFEPSNDKSKSAIVIRFKHNGQSGLPYPFEDGVLAYAFYPYKQSLGAHSDIYMNDAYNWQEMHTATGINLFKVFVHELGHSLGLSHSEFREDIMYPIYQPNDNVVIVDDTAQGIYKLYGFPPEKDEPTEEETKAILESFIAGLIGMRGKKFLSDINEPEVVYIGRALGLEMSEDDIKKDSIQKIMKKLA